MCSSVALGLSVSAAAAAFLLSAAGTPASQRDAKESSARAIKTVALLRRAPQRRSLDLSAGVVEAAKQQRAALIQHHAVPRARRGAAARGQAVPLVRREVEAPEVAVGVL